MLAGSWFGRQTEPPLKENEETLLDIKEENKEDKLQHELQKILEQIDGINQVSVFISIVSSSSYDYAVDKETTKRRTEEDDGDGGSRIIEEETTRDNYVILREEGGAEQALLLEEKYPVINGVLVVAGGADRAEQKEQIIRALVSILEVPAHRVTVLPGKN